jgi:acyl dehydratase
MRPRAYRHGTSCETFAFNPKDQLNMKRRLNGKSFDDIKVGDTFVTPTRTITEADLVMFCNLIWDTAPLHTDLDFVRNTPALQAAGFRDRIIPSSFLVGICAGFECFTDLHFGRGIAILGLEAKFHAPLYPGDTVGSEIKIVEARPSRKDPRRGIIKYVHTLSNQDDQKICEVTRTILQERDPVQEGAVHA